MRIIIAAGGQGKRWNNYLNTNKHLLKIDNEPILVRTVRQFKKYTSNIIIVSDIDYNHIAETRNPVHGEFLDFGKIYSSHNFWSDDRTIIVFGDTYFTDEAVDKIVNDQEIFRFFLRKGASSYTGKDHKEIFAVAFNKEMNNKIKESLEVLIKRQQQGPGAWRLYLYLHNLEQEKKNFYNTDGYVHIDDWTEDFDYPIDFKRWMKRRGMVK